MTSSPPLVEPEQPKPQRCQPCLDFDHFLCEGNGCPCTCGRNYYGDPVPGAHRYDALPVAGTKGRRNWIGRNAPHISPGEWHLHAVFNRGRVMWTLSSKASGVCKQEGRCQIVTLALRGDA